LANAYRLNGDSAAALSTVDQAIEVATERHARVPECLARIVRADLLLRSTTGDQEAEGRHELEQAIALMRETGAMIFEAFINVNKRRAQRWRSNHQGELELLSGQCGGMPPTRVPIPRAGGRVIAARYNKGLKRELPNRAFRARFNPCEAVLMLFGSLSPLPGRIVPASVARFLDRLSDF